MTNRISMSVKGTSERQQAPSQLLCMQTGMKILCHSGEHRSWRLSKRHCLLRWNRNNIIKLEKLDEVYSLKYNAHGAAVLVAVALRGTLVSNEPTMTSWAGITVDSDPCEFWYGKLPASWAAEVTFQPLDFISGYEVMNAWTAWLDNSCSRMIRPGFLGPWSRSVCARKYRARRRYLPVSHFVISVLTCCSVGPPGSPNAQSLVLKGW